MVLSNLNPKKIVESLKSLFNSNNLVKESLEELKEQNEDHLISINENTNEIQSNYEYSLELNQKINKLAERIDEISMLLNLKPDQKSIQMPKLTTVEKEIFLALYSICEQQEYATYKEIGDSVNLSETLIMNYITILIEKGVPIIKSYNDDKTKLKLSSYFKDLQTKSNILKITEDISQQSALNKFVKGKN